MSWRWWACEVIRAPGVGLIVWTLTHTAKSDWASGAKQNKLKKKKWWVIVYYSAGKRSFGRTNSDAASVPPTSPSSINTPERVAPLMSDNELLHRRKRGTILLKGTFASASRKEDRLLQSPPLPPPSSTTAVWNTPASRISYNMATRYRLKAERGANPPHSFPLKLGKREKNKIITRGAQTSLIFPVNIRPSTETINLKVALKTGPSWSFANNNHQRLYFIIIFFLYTRSGFN